MRKLTLFLALLCPAMAFGQGAVVPIPPTLGPTGAPKAGATISFCVHPATGNPCTNFASAFSDAALTQAINQTTNPLKTDGLGNAPTFYAAPGQYDYTLSGAGITTPSGPYVVVVSCIPGVTCVATSANNAFTGNNTHSGAETFTGAVTAGQLNNIVYIDGPKFATLAAYLAAPSANTTVIVPSNQTISSSIAWSVANLIIKCENNATITFTSAGRLLPSGVGSGFEGCNFVGPGVGITVAGAQIVMSGGGTTGNQPGVFRKNVVSNFGPTTGNGIVEIGGGSHWDISNNYSANNADLDFFVNNVTAASTMTDIRFENNDVGEFVVHATAAGSIINEIAVAGNHFHAGQNSKIAFCEEIGVFGGASVGGLTDTGNKCWLTAGGTNGGYSYSNVNDFAQSGNQFFANGFQFTVAAYEHLGNRGTISGNEANLGTVSGTPISCFDINPNGGNNTQISVTGNTCVASYTGAGIFAALYMGMSSALSLTKVNVTGNTFDVSGSTGKVAGIWAQVNNAGATVSNISVQGNHLFGPATASDNGIVFERDLGTMANNLVGQNYIFNFNTPYSSNAGTPTAGFAAGTVNAGWQFLSGNDTVVGIAATQTLTNKTLTAPIASTIGPSAAQQHTIPAVASDTVALLSAAQTFTGKTVQFGVASFAAQTALIATANLVASAPIGEYLIQIYMPSTVSCATPGPAQVVLTLGWTDETGARTQTFTQALGTTTGLTNTQIPVWVNAAANITYSTAYTACTTGTGTYALRLSAAKVQ